MRRVISAEVVTPEEYLKQCIGTDEDIIESITYTKCGIQCKICKNIEVIREGEFLNTFPCIVCAKSNWEQVRLDIHKKGKK